MDFKVPVAFVDVALLHVEVGIFCCVFGLYLQNSTKGGGKMATLVGQKNGYPWIFSRKLGNSWIFPFFVAHFFKDKTQWAL